ncbi:type II secretion system protein, partial [Candidatus Saccharibacteria bacterium]|nr:type II secretion system protein [Candidatus Saccharibacteria bacterium]
MNTPYVSKENSTTSLTQKSASLLSRVFSCRTKRGDTLIEVMFAVGVFGMVAVGAIGIMNRGLYGAQENLEVTMARSEIDTQAEALRFIHDAYISNSGNKNSPYAILWEKIASNAYNPSLGGGSNSLPANFYSSYSDEESYTDRSCADIYAAETSSIPANAIVLNPRLLGTKELENAYQTDSSLSDVLVTASNGKLTETPTYPRLLYSKGDVSEDDETLSDVDTNSGLNRLYENSEFDSAQGIWVTGVASGQGISCGTGEGSYRPDYYDFYIRTCWNSPDGKATANTVSSTIRLFNPDQINISKATDFISEPPSLYFVLTWTESRQLDVDSHLEGKNENGNDFHVSYVNKKAGRTFTNSLGQEVNTFSLDIDSVSSRDYKTSSDEYCSSYNCGDGKIEVITFRKIFPGDYEYYARNFTDGGLPYNTGGRTADVKV